MLDQGIYRGVFHANTVKSVLSSPYEAYLGVWRSDGLASLLVRTDSRGPTCQGTFGNGAPAGAAAGGAAAGGWAGAAAGGGTAGAGAGAEAGWA